MNKYIVAYIGLFENQLKQTLVEATSESLAVYKYLAEFEDITFEDFEKHNNIEDIAEMLYNMVGSNISVYKLD
jgi:hypothetical protein